MRRQVAAGENPVERKRREREAATHKTFQALADRYLNEHARRHKRSASADERNLRLHVLCPHEGRLGMAALGTHRGRKTTFFAFDLPHSDACFVVAYPAETTEAFCDGHVQAFAFFGGVPRSILYDNTKHGVRRIRTPSLRVLGRARAAGMDSDHRIEFIGFDTDVVDIAKLENLSPGQVFQISDNKTVFQASTKLGPSVKDWMVPLDRLPVQVRTQSLDRGAGQMRILRWRGSRGSGAVRGPGSGLS